MQSSQKPKWTVGFRESLLLIGLYQCTGSTLKAFSHGLQRRLPVGRRGIQQQRVPIATPSHSLIHRFSVLRSVIWCSFIWETRNTKTSIEIQRRTGKRTDKHNQTDRKTERDIILTYVQTDRRTYKQADACPDKWSQASYRERDIHTETRRHTETYRQGEEEGYLCKKKIRSLRAANVHRIS